MGAAPIVRLDALNHLDCRRLSALIVGRSSMQPAGAWMGAPVFNQPTLPRWPLGVWTLYIVEGLFSVSSISEDRFVQFLLGGWW